MSDILKDIRRSFYLPSEDIKRFIKSFYSEMEKGLMGHKSSLKMLPTYATRPQGTEKGSFLGLDLGGTNFRVASLQLKGKRRVALPQIEKFAIEKRLMHSRADLLFDFIARSIKDFMTRHRLYPERGQGIGFTFSFPIKKRGIAHGILVRWTKGFAAEGAEGQNIVRLLNESLVKNGIANAKVVAIINDTVSTLIAQSYIDPHCDIGVILGTGTNACYYEKLSRIPKLRSKRTPAEMVVNIEWGNFNKLNFTHYDIKLDQLSPNPGEQLLEKMVSGMYLGSLAGLILADLDYLADPKDFKSEYISEIEADNTAGLIRVGALLKRLKLSGIRYPDREVFKKVCTFVSMRAARLAAAAMASVITKIDPYLRREHTIAVDGALYEKHPQFARRVRSTLNEIFGKSSKNIKLKMAKDASVKGAAIIAATV